jgi:hypothetical protein
MPAERSPVTHLTKPSSRPTLSVVATSDPLATFLERLEHVRKCGGGYIARCPAHEDKTASLSIARGEDGRVLLNCFAGCPAIEVVSAVRLTVADLFIRRPTADMTFADREALRQRAATAKWGAALNALALEINIAAIAARDVRDGKALSDEDDQRVRLACQRIDHAREVLLGRRYS